MLDSNSFSDFFVAIANDPRINTMHVSLYMALLHYWKEHHFETPVQAFSYQLMQIAKISSSSSYHKSIRDLHAFGYIRYEPSYKRNQGSKIYLVATFNH